MGSYLNEEQVGHDREIGYPNLLSCMGFTMMLGDGSLVGAHYTIPQTEDPIRALQSKVLRQSGKTMMRAYAVGHIQRHIDWGGRDPVRKARALGFSGEVYIFDTGPGYPQGGVFAKLTTVGMEPHPETIVNRNDQMTYLQTGINNPNVFSPAGFHNNTTRGSLRTGLQPFIEVQPQDWHIEIA